MLKDLTGQIFRRWTVLKRAGSNYRGRAVWECKCICGTHRLVSAQELLNGHSKSCGCLKLEMAVANCRARATHGHAPRGQQSAEYRAWSSMWSRCTNPKQQKYPWYGGRGVKVCERWRSFENFLADMGTKPPGMTLDRIDPSGNYEPGNCRWATWKEQRANRRKAA